MRLSVKRVYEKPAREDGTRVLVDRLWPRGLTKEAAAVDVWLRELAPSNDLRKWFHENRAAWTVFRRQYARELRNPEATRALQQLYELMSRKKSITLLFASTNLERNNGVALKKMVEGARKPPTGAELARAARSPSSFKRDFQTSFQEAPGKWLLRKRLDYSAALLRTSKMNVTEIAFESGFEDVSHFSRVFKERFDVPPMTYRQAGPCAE
ncbi:MAG: DUF488 family protein [Verrucomicrobia bacterium]|nr:DUF488 family protein [Verrucomicrobiota bacterium]